MIILIQGSSPYHPHLHNPFTSLFYMSFRMYDMARPLMHICAHLKF